MSNLPGWAPIALMVVGILLVLRAVVVTIKSEGRFRGDAFTSTVCGFALILLGQFLLAD